jgi:hypothetical protein
MYKKISIVLFLLISLVPCLAISEPTNKIYIWDDIIKFDYSKLTYTNNSPTYIGNYQDYWIDWSPDSSKIIALCVDNKEIGIHVLDLSKMKYGLNNQNIFVPFDDYLNSKPIIWKAKIKTVAMKQASPGWSKYSNIVGYIENTIDYKSSTIVIADIEKNTYKEIAIKNISKIKAIDFSWNKDLLLAYGSNRIVLYDFIKNKEIKYIEFKDNIIQAGWFPDDENIFLVYGTNSYKYEINSKKEIPFLDYKGWSKVSFIPNTKEVVIALMNKGIIRWNYELNELIPLTKGIHYQPQVSKDGKFFSYISETPWGGFISSTELIKPELIGK